MIILLALLRIAQFFRQKRPVAVWNEASAPIYSGEPLRVVVWNIQYGAGIRQHFFYDGGVAVSAPVEEVLATTEAIGESIAKLQPDIVMLQEVDRRSRRTGYVDEYKVLAEILARHGLSCGSTASYWRMIVPHPKHEYLGRIGMHLATFSRYQIKKSTRWQLPLLRESRLRRLFNLRRAVHDCELKVQGCKPLSVINTHLSAFSRGDGTLERQVDVVCDGVLPLKKDESWLLAGDFNCISPFEDPTLLEQEADLYPKDKTDVQRLYDHYNPAFATDDLRRPTYKPYHAPSPDRTIDHAFASDDCTYDAVDVPATGSGFLSDHQPLCLDVRFS